MSTDISGQIIVEPEIFQWVSKVRSHLKLVNVFSRGLGERKMTLDGECKLLRGLLEDKKKAGVMISSMWH